MRRLPRYEIRHADKTIVIGSNKQYAKQLAATYARERMQRRERAEIWRVDADGERMVGTVLSLGAIHVHFDK